MSALKSLFLLAVAILFIISAIRHIYQERGDFVDKGTPLKIDTQDLVGTDDYLYAAGSCLDWKGNIIWENPGSSKFFIVYLGDTLYMDTWQQKKSGVALVTLEGEILWQRDVERIAHVGIGASHELLAAGTRKEFKVKTVFTTDFSRWKDECHRLQGYLCQKHGDSRTYSSRMTSR